MMVLSRSVENGMATVAISVRYGFAAP